MVEEGLVVFNSTHDSIKADNICLEREMGASLIPTHPSIGVGCGFMLKTAWDNFDNIVRMLEDEKIKFWIEVIIEKVKNLFCTVLFHNLYF